MNKKKNWDMKVLTSKRSVLLLGGIMLLLLVCIGRIGWLTVIKGEEYREKAEKQKLSESTIVANRGTIYDRNKNVLAQSADTWLVEASPSYIYSDQSDLKEEKQYTPEQRMQILSQILAEEIGIDQTEFYNKLKAKCEAYLEYKQKKEAYDQKVKNGQTVSDDEKPYYSDYLYVCGDLEYDQKTALMDRIDEYNLGDVINTGSDSKRYYPNSSLASTVLGFTGRENTGLYGLEQKYENILAGSNGKKVTAVDSRRREIENAYTKVYDAVDGNSLVLTIDSEIQTILEDLLTTAKKDTQAAKVYGIVMNTKTGAILAMADLPNYDLNNPNAILDETLVDYINANGTDSEKSNPEATARTVQWKNKCLSDFYYPGSVYKVILVAGALEDGVIDANTAYNCTGTITIDNRTIKDYYTTGHGVETPCSLLVNSCNTFAITVGLKMGTETYFKYFQAFGFTEKTGIDLSGEESPSVNNTYHDPSVSFTKDNLISASFGQSISVTPLQMITAVSAIGNGGKLMQPYVVAKQLDAKENVVVETQPTVKRQVISEEVAKKVGSWMVKVVNEGTGKNAYVAGYQVAGKTGTSEKLKTTKNAEDGTTESEKKYVASFAGFAPYDDPQISVLIVIDEPGSDEYSGGAIAAPIGGELIEKTLKYLGIEPDYSDATGTFKLITAPKVTEISVEDAKSQLSDLGLNVRVIGEGDTVFYQCPEEGRQLPSNGVVILYTQSNAQKEMVSVPDFSGLNVKQASALALSNNINVKILGNASDSSDVIAYKQETNMDTMVEKGSVISVYFRTTNGVHD